MSVLALAAAVSRKPDPAGGRLSAQNLLWTGVAVLATGAVTLTHHLTSYVLAALLVSLAIGAAVVARRGGTPSWIAPWDLAAFAIVASAAWLLLKAGETTQYLGPIFGTALDGGISVVSGDQSTRELFATDSGYTAPAWERIVSLGALLLTAVGVVVGALKGGAIVGSKVLFRLVVLVSFAYLGSFGLRFIPSAWEVANRMTDYAYIAVAALLAATTIHLVGRKSRRAVGSVALGIGLGVLTVGADADQLAGLGTTAASLSRRRRHGDVSARGASRSPTGVVTASDPAGGSLPTVQTGGRC